ncbi:MAG: hypothetical protein JO015_10375 [Verrucomicrobia bacterium]|nr:hypothetical protein [Verrucomicrobiota bacterium]
MKIKALFLAVAVLGSVGFVRADDVIQFTTLPQTVQTTVIRETHISNPTSVTRVIRDGDVYAVTVRGDSGSRVVYVNDAGTIVEHHSAATTTTTTTTEQVAPAAETVVTTEQVQGDTGRYQLIEKKGNKETYLDRQTGQKVRVKREDND